MNPEITNQLALFLLLIWDLIWKGIGLWKAAHNNQKNWFVALLVLNTVGILPIIYLKFFQKKHPASEVWGLQILKDKLFPWLLPLKKK